ncbi:hypothetical protein V6N12_000338 [Hibiscus sabdariffa]|uniref:RNase H type-1 domain-containing protein n=1 Tax=Hibiscus sabdariffa TaxID=183260 RepID=A0ABR2B334_9ROSI
MLKDKWGGDKAVTLRGTYLDSPAEPVQCQEFMVHGQNEWDASKVQHVFMEDDAREILRCPISGTNEDKLIWGHNSTGMIFGWRLEQNALPVGQRLRVAQVGSGECKMCGCETESVLHAIRECPKVQEVFKVSGLDELLPQGPFAAGLEWLEECRELLDGNRFTFLIVLLWNVWNRRNRWVHSNQMIPARSKNWKKPGEGQIKVNVDGAWLDAERWAAIGIVARDHNGLMLDGCSKLIVGSQSPETTEAQAFAEGIILVVEHRWDNVVIERDAVSVVNRLKNPGVDFSVATTYLEQAKSILKERPGFEIQHVTRDANRVAHVLAQ